MTNELRPKIWEFKLIEADSPDLVLDYFHADRQIDFNIIAPAIEAIIGVELVSVTPEGNKMRVIARNTSQVYMKFKPLFEHFYGVTPFVSWANDIDPTPRNDFEGHRA